MSQYIDSDEKLKEISKLLKNNDYIILDTEFIREKNYYPKLCLIQVAASNNVLACIDPLAINDLSPFIEILKDPSITKVFHASYQDLEIFYYLMDCVPAPIFDTQPAASVLGIGDQIGYARLVEELLGVQLEKSQSRTDWSRRPLSQKQIDYAIDDVRYLQKIYPLMRSKLEQKNRLEWLDADFNYLTSNKTYAVDFSTCWKRVKAKQTLKGIQLAVLQQLATWREEVAIQKDRPRRWIVSDDILIDLSRRKPKNTVQIAQIRGADEKHLKRYYQAWIKAIQAGEDSPPETWPKLPTRRKASLEEDILVDLLMTLVRYQAKEHGVSASVIASRKQVMTMLQEQRDTFSNDWRGALLNTLFQDVLSGKAQVSVQEGNVVIQDRTQVTP